MKLDILTPEKKIYEGDVYGIYLPGVSGYFEILDKHAPMVAALGEGEMKILTDKTSSESYDIQGGFLEMNNNKAVVLIEGAEKR